MKKLKRTMTGICSLLCAVALITPNVNVKPVQAEPADPPAFYIDTSVSQGRDSDVEMTELVAPNTAQGKSVTIEFLLTSNFDFTAASVDTTTSDFPFVKNENAYHIVVPAERSDQPMRCSFTLDVKSSVVTGYYPINFCVEYVKHGHHNYVNKTVDIYISGKASSTGATDAYNSNEFDVQLLNLSAPRTVAGSDVNVGFDLRSEYSIKSVSLNTSDSECPFVKNENVYHVIQGGDDVKAMNCNFGLNVKSDLIKGYYPVVFHIDYVKDGQETSINKTFDIYIDGEEETDKDTPSESTPRVIVTGFTTTPEKIFAGDEFELKVALKNTATIPVSNMKLSLTSANNEFLPCSGSSTMFVERIPAGGTYDLSIRMKAQSNLEQKPYVLSVEMEYESEKHKMYTAKESISVPIYLVTKLKVTSFEIRPDIIEVGSQANVMFNINNAGKAPLSNVQVSIENDYVQCDEVYVGNIAAGGIGYADFMVTGVAPTQDDGMVKIIISYEDSAGIEGTYEASMNIFVNEFAPMDMPTDYPIDEPMPEQKSASAFVWVGIVAAALVLVAIIIIIKKKKKEEDMEDELS